MLCLIREQGQATSFRLQPLPAVLNQAPVFAQVRHDIELPHGLVLRKDGGIIADRRGQEGTGGGVGHRIENRLHVLAGPLGIQQDVDEASPRRWRNGS